MGISQSMLPEFDNEMANTRKTLERIPGDRFDWKPHEKSMALGYMASHLATLPGWVNTTIGHDSFDMAPVDGERYTVKQGSTREEILKMFDESVAAARDALAGASDEELLGDWSLQLGGKTIMTMPRVVVVRNFVLNHMIHHRAQLGVYLRLNDIPVPSIYGPSADENPFG